jgi:hypothetical protein
VIQSVGAGLIALFILSRSNLSSSRTLKMDTKNPFDKKTDGYITPNGGIVQPTYGMINVAFPLPEIKKCKYIGKTDDGVRSYYVYYVAASPDRVDITVPSGSKGAGNVFNTRNLVRANLGEGYYTIVKKLKSNSGDPYPINYPSSYRDIGLPNYYYETAQRYVVYSDKQTAIDAAQAIFDNWNDNIDPEPSPDDPPTPELPPFPPNPLPPTIPPINPSLPPTLGGGGVSFTEATQKAEEMDKVEIEEIDTDLIITPRAVMNDQTYSLNGGSSRSLMGY